MNRHDDGITLLIIVAAGSAVIGIGKLLQSGEAVTLKLVIGRATVTSALGVGAFALLAWLPDVPDLALVGIAALLASLGESALEGLINAYFKRGK